MSKRQKAAALAGVLHGVARPPRKRNTEALSAIDLITCMQQVGVVLPEEICTVEVKVSADSLTQIIYTCNVTGELEHKIGKAMQLHAVKQRLSR